MFLNSELFGHQRGQSNKGYKLVQHGDLILSTQNLHLGNANVNMRFEHGMVSPAYKTYRIVGCSSELLSHWVKSDKAKEFFFNATTVGASVCRRNVEWETLYNQIILLPQAEEQSKIANFLSLISERIEKQQNLVSALKSYKRGLLSLVFNDKSPTHILGDILKKGKAGGTPQSSNFSYYNGDIPFLSIADMTEQGKYIYCTEKHISEAGLQNSTAWIVPADSLILSMYASYGLVSINKVPLATSQAMFNMIFQQDINVEYIYYFLTYLATTDYYTKMVSTGTQPNLNAEKVRSIPLFIPSQNEQKHIVKLLQTYDNRLTTEEKILTQLQMSKAALLQQLFI